MLSESTPGRAPAAAIAAPGTALIGLFSAMVRTTPGNQAAGPRRRGAVAADAPALLAAEATTDDSETMRSAPPARPGAAAVRWRRGSVARCRPRQRERSVAGIRPG